MQIFKIDSINRKNNNINFQSKRTLTRVKIQPKMDMFCKSPEIKEALMNNFIKLRDGFAEKLYPIALEASIADWNFYINSNDEKFKVMSEASDEYEKLWQDKNLYNEFLRLKDVELSKHEKKQLKNIIKGFEDQLNSGEDLKQLRNKENEIAQKYNSYVPKIDGKETTKAEINKILETESNPELRQKAYEANVKGGDLIASDLQEFAKMRNAYARTKGYSNYFEYKLKDAYEVDINELENLLEDIYSQSKDLIEIKVNENKKDLSEFFGINNDDLKSYHYGFLTDNNPEKKVNDYLKTKEQVVEIAKKAYKKMGYDIDKLQEEGKLTLDLFPRKNKNTHGFCFYIESGKDARILANLTNNTTSLDTLNHELGHCVYTLGHSKDLPYFDKEEYPAMTEAVAMMMQDLGKRENILDDIVDKDILKEYKKTFVDDEVKFLTKALTLINFEKEMYKNPDQDLKKLWRDMKVKYQMRSEKEELDNGWATIPHFLSHPAYYQNYFRATIIKAQMYNYLTSKLGNLTENKNTSKVLKDELFKFGISMEENELIENMTGKKLSVEDFIKSIKD